MIHTIDTQLASDRQRKRLADARAYRLARLARGRTRGGRRDVLVADRGQLG